MSRGNWIKVLREAPDTVTRQMLWFGLWGGGAAWLGHLLLCWVIGEFGCVSSFREVYFAGFTGIAWLIFLVTVVAAAGALYATLLSWQVEKKLRSSGKEEGEDHCDLFLGRAGWITSGLFFIFIVVQCIPIFFYLRNC
jgi:hypothetical protein